MIKRAFTLIELVVVIVVLGILAAIVIPNVSSMQEEATETAIVSNVKNLQTGVDMFALKKLTYPTFGQPEALIPSPINFEEINPDYIRNLPKTKDMKYWVDYKGKVWASNVDSPTDVSKDGSELSWSEVENAEFYRIYQVNDKKTSSTSNKSQSFKYIMDTKTYSNTEVEIDETYAVSSVDKNGFESPPVGLEYEGYESYISNSSTPVVPTVQWDDESKDFISWAYSNMNGTDIGTVDDEGYTYLKYGYHFKYKEINTDPAVGLTMEMESRLNQDSGNYAGASGDAIMQISDIGILLYSDHVEFVNKTVRKTIMTLDTKSTFHKYRMTIKDTLATVYVDGIEVYSTTIVNDGVHTKTLKLGDSSNNSYILSGMTIKSFNYSTSGAFKP